MKIDLTKRQLDVIRRGLGFALDMGEDSYFAFYPDEDQGGGYSDGDQEQDEAARSVARELVHRLRRKRVR